VRLPAGVLKLVKELAKHVFRHPLVGIAAAARTPDGRWLLIRRGDTGTWALPGGALDWGETLRTAIVRELDEEAGVDVIELGGLVGVYSAPARDPRVHGVTIVVHAKVTLPARPPHNPAEILEIGLFADDELPETLAHCMTDMLVDAREGRVTWE